MIYNIYIIMNIFYFTKISINKKNNVGERRPKENRI